VYNSNLALLSLVLPNDLTSKVSFVSPSPSRVEVVRSTALSKAQKILKSLEK
jgi:hypothetical protein